MIDWFWLRGWIIREQIAPLFWNSGTNCSSPYRGGHLLIRKTTNQVSRKKRKSKSVYEITKTNRSVQSIISQPKYTLNIQTAPEFTPQFHPAPEFTQPYISPHPLFHPSPCFTPPLFHPAPMFHTNSPCPRFHPAPDFTPSHITPAPRFLSLPNFSSSQVSLSPRLPPFLGFTPPQISPCPRFHPAPDSTLSQVVPHSRHGPSRTFTAARILPRPGARDIQTLVSLSVTTRPDSPTSQDLTNTEHFLGGVESGRVVKLVCMGLLLHIPFKTTFMCPRSIAGVPLNQALPGFLITAPPSVFVPAVICALAVWIQHWNTKKLSRNNFPILVNKTKKDTRPWFHCRSVLQFGLALLGFHITAHHLCAFLMLWERLWERRRISHWNWKLRIVLQILRCPPGPENLSFQFPTNLGSQV